MASRTNIDCSNYVNNQIIDNSVENNYPSLEYQGSGGASGSGGGGFGRVISCEIEEEVINTSGGQMETIIEEDAETGSLFSLDFKNFVEVVHVGITRKNEDTSMDALRWALSHFVIAIPTLISLVYTYPVVKKIPTLLGKIPIDQASPEQKKNYLADEECKRNRYLQKFRNVCASFQVNVETIMVESDIEAKTLVDLIPGLHIRKLVVGTSKRNITSSKRVGGGEIHILRRSPEYCKVKIICEGKEVGDKILRGVAHHHDQASLQASSSNATPKFVRFHHDQLELGQEANYNTNYNRLFCVSCVKPAVID